MGRILLTNENYIKEKFMHPKLLNQYIIRTSNFLDDKIINDITRGAS